MLGVGILHEVVLRCKVGRKFRRFRGRRSIVCKPMSFQKGRNEKKREIEESGQNAIRQKGNVT